MPDVGNAFVSSGDGAASSTQGSAAKDLEAANRRLANIINKQADIKELAFAQSPGGAVKAGDASSWAPTGASSEWLGGIVGQNGSKATPVGFSKGDAREAVRLSDEAAAQKKEAATSAENTAKEEAAQATKNFNAALAIGAIGVAAFVSGLKAITDAQAGSSKDINALRIERQGALKTLGYSSKDASNIQAVTEAGNTPGGLSAQQESELFNTAAMSMPKFVKADERIRSELQSVFYDPNLTLAQKREASRSPLTPRFAAQSVSQGSRKYDASYDAALTTEASLAGIKTKGQAEGSPEGDNIRLAKGAVQAEQDKGSPQGLVSGIGIKGYNIGEVAVVADSIGRQVADNISKNSSNLLVVKVLREIFSSKPKTNGGVSP
jgi:hypothetical protein